MTSFRTAYTLTTNYSLTLITTTTILTKSVLSFVTFVPPFMFTNETEVHGERKTARESKFYAEIK